MASIPSRQKKGVRLWLRMCVAAGAHTCQEWGLKLAPASVRRVRRCLESEFHLRLSPGSNKALNVIPRVESLFGIFYANYSGSNKIFWGTGGKLWKVWKRDGLIIYSKNKKKKKKDLRSSRLLLLFHSDSFKKLNIRFRGCVQTVFFVRKLFSLLAPFTEVSAALQWTFLLQHPLITFIQTVWGAFFFCV